MIKKRFESTWCTLLRRGNVLLICERFSEIFVGVTPIICGAQPPIAFLFYPLRNR